MSGIVSAPLPQRRSLLRQWHKVTGPRGKRPFVFGCLSADVLGVYVHFDQTTNRLAPCSGEEGCKYDHRKIPRRWMGYAAGVMGDTKELVVAEVTEGAARHLQDIGLIPGKLRGMIITLYRDKDHRNAPVRVKVDKCRDMKKVPESFDVLPHLLRLWGWNAEHDKQIKENVNPVDPRLNGGAAAIYLPEGIA